MVECRVGNGCVISFMIDSGADVNVISESDWKRIYEMYQNGKATLFDIREKPTRKIHAFASKTL